MKYEYKIIRFTAGKYTELDILNKLGEEEWELSSIVFTAGVLFYYLKRRKLNKFQKLLKLLKLI